MASEVVERAHPLTPLVKAWIVLVGFVFFAGREVIERGNDWPSFDEVGQRVSDNALLILGIVGGLVALALAAGFWSWWTNKFVISPTELRIENTGAFTQSKRIAYSRIQSVDLVQPFAARLLGLAQLSIDAGSEGPTKIAYLRRSRAVTMRDELLRRAHGLTSDASDAPVDTSAWDDRAASDQVLIRVPPKELALGALLSHELLLLIAAAAIPMIIGAVLNEPMLAVGGGIIPIVFAMWGFVSKRVIGQWNYTLADTGAGLRITRGLTTLSSGSVPVSRVQAIRIHEPVLWRRIGRARVDLSLLNTKISTDEDGAGASSIMLPIGNRWAVDTALKAVWPGLDLDAVALTPAPRTSRWLAPLGWRWIAHGSDDQVVVLRRGWWTRTTWVIPHARLQSAVAAQGPVRRRLQVATVTLHTSGVGMGSPSTYLDARAAHAFVFDEMRRAKDARSADELTVTPPLG